MAASCWSVNSGMGQLRLQGWLLGLVQAAGLGYTAGHTVVARARAFVVQAVDGEVAVTNVLDEFADEIVNDGLRVLPTAGWFIFVDFVGEGAAGVVTGAHAP